MTSKKRTAAQTTQPSDRPQKNGQLQNAKPKHRVRDQVLLWGYAVIFGVLAVLTKIFSAALANGDASYFVHAFNYISWENILIFVVVMLVVRWLVGKLVYRVDSNFSIETSTSSKNKRKALSHHSLELFSRQGLPKIATPRQFFWTTLVITSISFGLVLLLFYPGTAMNDTISSSILPISSTLHPVAFQWVLGQIFGFVYGLTGHMALAAAVITALQVITAVLIWSYLVCWLRRHQARISFCWLVILFAAFYPVVASYAVCVIKDVWFALSVLLLLPTAFSILFDPKPRLKDKILFIVAVLGCTLFRTNGFMVVLVTLISMSVYLLIKSHRGRFAVILFAIGISVISQVGTTAFVKINHIRQTSVTESLGIPMAQIAAVIHKYNGVPPTEVISAEDQEFLAQILPLRIWSEEYRYSFTDTIKFNENFNDSFFQENVGRFISIWAHTLLVEPDVYVTAYFAQTYGLWNLAFWDTDKYDAGQSVFLSYKNNVSNDWMIESYAIQDISNQPQIFSDEFGALARRYFGGSLRICFALNAGIIIMFILLISILLVIWGQSRYLLILIPLITTWGTMMIATPASMMYRYNVYLVFALPIIIFLLGFAANKRKTGRVTR